MDEYRSTEIVKAERVTERQEFNIDGCLFVVNPGEWIVWYGDPGEDRPWVCTDATFQTHYYEKSKDSAPKPDEVRILDEITAGLSLRASVFNGPEQKYAAELLETIERLKTQHTERETK